MAINSVVLSGRLTADPELKYTSGNQTPVTNFNLAVQYNNEETYFPSCVAWEKTAEVIANNCLKGDKIIVAGMLKTRVWTNDQGENKYITEVVVSRMDFAGQKQNQEAEQPAPAPQPPQRPAQTPAQNRQSGNRNNTRSASRR